MKRIGIRCFGAAFILLVVCASLWAQAAAQVSGTARDQSGAVLPGVEITVTQIDTGSTRNTITNETGSYVLPNLSIGPYRLEAALPGFRTYAQTGIVLQVNSSSAINVVMEVGQVAETVEVQANAALVETRSASVGQVVENARILELPLNGRQVTELIALAGAATPSTTGTNARDPFATTTISVAGGSSMGLNYTLDGANHNNPAFNLYMVIPFPDALQEFKVETSATTAQSGVKSAGSVNLVTKSGTNEFHGNLFEFVRNGMFNARNAFATRRDTLKRNQFGGTAGGPILSNKLFFFAGYQGTTVRQDPSDTIVFVPTPAMMAGDFTAIASPACNVGRQITLRAPFVNNRIDPALFSRPAVNFAKLLPATTDPCGQIIRGNITLENRHTAVGRIDYQRNANHSLFGRYIMESAYIPPSYNLNKNLLSAGVGNDGLSQAFALGSTYLIGSNIVNSFRFTASRMAGGRTAAEYISWPEMGVQMFTYEPKRLAVTVTGGWSISPGGAGATRLALFGINDDLSVIRGNHQLAVGANVATWWMNSYSDFYSYGRATFNGQTTGLGMADFFMGNVSEWVMGAAAPQFKRDKYVGVYGADTWKVSPRLTVNYGLRWQPYFPMINIDGSALHFDLDGLRKGAKSTQFRNAPPGLFFTGDPGFPGDAGMNNQWWHLSPRVGLAWDVSGDGRTSIRASVATLYDYPPTFYQVGLSDAPPWNPRVTITDVRLDRPWASYPGGDPFPMPFGKNVSRDTTFPPFMIVTAMDYDTPNTMVSHWNLSLQRQVGADWLVSATYLGNSTSHLWSTQHINPGVFFPGNFAANGTCTSDGRVLTGGTAGTACSTTANTNQRRRLYLENPQTGQYYGYVNRIDSGGTANYNGLLVSVERRAARGVTVSSNYTWSHCITDPGGDAVGNSGSANAGYTNPDNRHFDRGNCAGSATDRRHNFNLSAVASTPQFSNATLRALGSGWRVAPILRILSGPYMSITTSTDLARSGIANQRVNQILAEPYGDKSINNYLNPAAFALPAVGTLGNGGAGAVAGPGTWQFDAALSRTFRTHEMQRLEFRAEAFNLTNSFRMNNPTTNLNTNTFGRVTSARDPRIMQFALKYFF